MGYAWGTELRMAAIDKAGVDTRSDVALAMKAALHRRIDDLTDDRDLLEAVRLLDQLGAQPPADQERELIARWIEPDPRGSYRARLMESGVPVYAVVARLGAPDEAPGDQVAAVARVYDVPGEAVEAALAYYRQHRFLIDAWNAMNAE